MTQNLAIAITGASALLLLVLLFLALRRKRQRDGAAYAARPALTEAELELHARLIKALPGYLTLAQVGYEHFIEVTGGHKDEQASRREPLRRASANFLVCRRDGNPVAVVTLESGAGRQDAAGAAILREAGLPLVRWRASNLPDEDVIRARIRHALSHDAGRPDDARVAPVVDTLAERHEETRAGRGH